MSFHLHETNKSISGSFVVSLAGSSLSQSHRRLRISHQHHRCKESHRGRLRRISSRKSTQVIASAGNGKTSLTEVNKELSNPISSIWALQFQQNTFWLNKPERNLVNLLFQPVLPVSLTGNWNLITRPVIPVFNSTTYVNKSGNLHRVTGFGDTVLVELLSPSPKVAGPWLFGAGPTFIFPTASNSRLGQNKWQIGPTSIFGYLGQKWLAGVFPQQWWSVGGPGSNTTSQMNLQYFFAYFPAAGWSVGTSPNMLVNWYARKSSNMITFPIGLSISKVVKLGPLPVKSVFRGSTCPFILMSSDRSGIFS